MTSVFMVWLWVSQVCAGNFSSQAVLVDVGEGARVNWTTLAVEIERESTASGTNASIQAVEQRARDAIEGIAETVVREVAVSHNLWVSDLLAMEEIGDVVVRAAQKWVVVESRYHASGRVVLRAELPLLQLLKAWSLTQVVPLPASASPDNETGLVIDVRGHAVRPVYAPRLVDGQGTVLFDGRLGYEVAVREAPVVYVTDAADPIAQRAGVRPLLLLAESVSDSDVVVAEHDVAAIRRLVDEGVLARGTLVLVIDP